MEGTTTLLGEKLRERVHIEDRLKIESQRRKSGEKMETLSMADKGSVQPVLCGIINFACSNFPSVWHCALLSVVI